MAPTTLCTPCLSALAAPSPLRGRTAGPGEAAAGRSPTLAPGRAVLFSRAQAGRATGVALGDQMLRRRSVGPETGNQLVITHVRPLAQLRRGDLARAAP